MYKVALLFVFLLVSCRCHAALELLPHTASPDKRLGFAVDHSADHVWLVRLPSLTPIGDPVDGSFGRPGRGWAEWNLQTRRVALCQGMIQFSSTRVFEYSKDSLKERSLPDLESLPRRWFPGAAAVMKLGRIFVSPIRWHGSDLLELAVEGSMWPQSDNRAAAAGATKLLEFDFMVLVRFNRDGSSKITNVKDRT